MVAPRGGVAVARVVRLVEELAEEADRVERLGGRGEGVLGVEDVGEGGHVWDGFCCWDVFAVTGVRLVGSCGLVRVVREVC